MDIVREFERYGRLEQLKRFYGFLFDSPLNGGRLRKDCKHFSLDVIDELNSMGIGYSFALNNVTVAQEYLEDPHSNEVLARFEKPLNGVIVATDVVADFIRENYPGYRLRASCIFDFLGADEINAALDRFDEVCVFPEVNHKAETLEAIKDKARVVLFGTSLCLNVCGRNRRHHYYILGQDHIAWYNHNKYGSPYRPKFFANPHMPWCRAREATPLVHDLEGLHAMGFQTFKITQFEMLKRSYFEEQDVQNVKWTRKRLRAMEKRPGA